MAGYKVHPRWVALVVAVVGLLGFFTPTYADSPWLGESPLSSLLWTVGEVGNRAGSAGVLITDLDGNGTSETLTCTADSPYFYRTNPQNPTRYYPFWYGERVACSALALGDADGDAVPELYIGSRTPTVYIYTYDSIRAHYERTAHIPLTGSEGVNGIAVGDVDGDSHLELVVTRFSTTTVYNAETYALEWEATGLGGTGVKIGNVDTDSTLEIIVNGATGYILNAATQLVEQTKSGGWGRVMEVGDTDDDGRAEIAYVRGTAVATSVVALDEVENGALHLKWELSAGYAEWLTIGEMDGAISGAEVVVGGDGNNDAIATRNGMNGALLWTIANPGSGVQGMGIGDSDNDGVMDIWWGSGHTSPSGDQLFVANSASRAITWRNRDYDGPFLTGAGDIDNDGTVELVALSTTMNDGNTGGVYLPYDSMTFEEEITRTTQVDSSAFIVAQVDNDSVLELVVGGQLHGATSAYVEVIDGTTRQTQWTRSGMGTGEIVDLKAVNVDTDTREELFIATPNRRVYVHDGASNTTEWEGGPYPAPIVDLEVADTDGDGILELGVLTTERFYVYSTQSWTLEQEIPVNQGGYAGSQVAAGNADGKGSGEWLIAMVNNTPVGGFPYESRLQSLDGASYLEQWTVLLSGVTIVELLTQPGDTDAGGRLYMGGYQQLSAEIEQPTYLSIAEYDELGLNERYTNMELWGNLHGMVLVDANQDGTRELFMGTSSLYQLRTTDPLDPTSVIVSSLKVHQESPHPLMTPWMLTLCGVGIVFITKRAIA